MSVLSHPVLNPTKPCFQAQGRGSDLQSDTNSQAGDLSILGAAESDIRGNEGDHKELVHRYHDATKFFRLERVFAMLWHKGAGDEKGGHLSQAEPFNVQVFGPIRRMVVLGARDGYCCVLINTYNCQGIAKKGLSPEDRQAHSFIYMDDTKPAIHPTETGMMFKPGFVPNCSIMSLRMVLVGIG